jgi:hypothetical protein
LKKVEMYKENKIGIYNDWYNNIVE